MAKRIFLALSLFFFSQSILAQNVMTPELLWKLGKVSGETISSDGKNVIYGVTFYDMAANKGERNLYSIPLMGGEAKKITSTEGAKTGVQITPSGKMGYIYKGQWWEAN